MNNHYKEENIQRTVTNITSIYAKMAVMAILMAGSLIVNIRCESKGEVEPKEEIDPKALAEKQKEWANLMLMAHQRWSHFLM